MRFGKWLGHELKPIYECFKEFKGGEISLNISKNIKNCLEININNPVKKNAISGKMMTDLFNIIAELEENKAKYSEYSVIILKSLDKNVGFCSGADFSLITKEGVKMSIFMQNILFRLKCLDFISVSQINKFSVGGGTELALATDLRFFSSNSFFQMVQPKMGLTPGWGGGQYLKELVGSNTAINILCSSHKLTPEKAKEIKVADEIYDSEENFEKLLFPYVNQPFVESIRACKKILLPKLSEEDFRIEHQQFVTQLNSTDHLSAISSVTKK